MQIATIDAVLIGDGQHRQEQHGLGSGGTSNEAQRQHCTEPSYHQRGVRFGHGRKLHGNR